MFIGTGFFMLIFFSQRYITKSLPLTEGRIPASFLEHSVRVYRDGYHVPHILAGNDRDLYFAQGYITAQDRMWQMDVWRRMACGKLSEVYGRTTLASDSLMNMLDISGTAEAIFKNCHPLSRQMLTAYTAGVNAYLTQNRNALPIEFQLMQFRPDPWQETDCVAILRLFGWFLNSRESQKILLCLIRDRLGSIRFDSLTGGLPSCGTAAAGITSSSVHAGMLLNAYKFLERSRTLYPFCQNICIALAGQRTETGKAMLMILPQGPMTNPSVWYENHLCSGSMNTAGISIPGMPGVWMGYNTHIAWGFSCSSGEDIVFRGIPPGATSPSVRTGHIHLPDSQWTVIIHESSGGFVQMPGGPDGVWMSWEGRRTSDELLAIYKINHAQSWNEFREASMTFRFPSGQMVFSDTAGNVGEIFLNARRNSRHDFVTPSPSGQAGCRISPDDSRLAAEWGIVPCRDMLRQMAFHLKQADSFSINDLKSVMAGTSSEYAKQICEEILPVIGNASFDSETVREAAALLRQWDHEYRSGSAAAILFEQWMTILLEDLFREDLGDVLFECLLSHPGLSRYLLSQNLFTPRGDERRTRRDDILLHSFAESVDTLAVLLDADPSVWAWGEEHTVTFEHPLSRLPFMKPVFNLGPFPVSGSGTTILGTGYDLRHPFQVREGATARMIVDLSRLENSISVLPTGQSGQPMDLHYRDQAPLYVANLYHPNMMDTVRIVRSGWAMLTMEPGENHE